MNRLIAASVLALTIATAAGLPQTATGDPLEYSWTELAPAVWTGIREDSPRIPVMGTTTFVVGDTGVVVFDGGGLPLMAERALAKVRSVTDRPVTHVVISHWHQDHNFGIKAFTDAFPGAEVVSHPYTRDTLIRSNSDPEGNFRETLRTAVSRDVDTVTGILEADQFTEDRPLTERDRARFRQYLADAPKLDAEYRRIEPVYPTMTFADSLVIHQQNREVHLLHLGRGNTAGDIVMWLPAERIVATGDMVVRPTPYGFGSYPAEWAQTLRKLTALDFQTLVPGHGDIQRDTRYARLLIETLELVAGQVEALVAQNLTEDEVIGRVDFSAVEERFTGGDAFLAGRFLGWFKIPIARAAYKIARGEPPENIQPR
jgi:glyoxylase-like metal-dependent hydrolase (beta-lactamase superfamily II)